jgi:hypothetical protein
MREREPRPHTQRGDLVVSRATMDALRASLRGGASNDITDSPTHPLDCTRRGGSHASASEL